MIASLPVDIALSAFVKLCVESTIDAASQEKQVSMKTKAPLFHCISRAMNCRKLATNLHQRGASQNEAFVYYAGNDEE